MAYITLNKNHFFNNLDIIANKTKTKDKIAVVLKDNAYGHGILEIASMAKEYGITKAVVRCIPEAKMIEEYFEYILVLADIPQEASQKVRYTINDINDIKKFPKNTKVELKVDSGMHRNGVSIEQLPQALESIKKNELILEALFTHHRSADELTSEWFWQNENFQKAKDIVKNLGYENIRFHSANSASTLRHSKIDEDMVRVGVAIYGCADSDILSGLGLKPVLSLWAERNSKRELKQEQRVGYGGIFESKEDVIVSNYDFGYADGFHRICSNNYTTPEGERLVGRISMDNSSFLSDKEKLLVFDDAAIIAKSAKTISYEVLTSLKSYIKKEII
ncbi:alanine racemase [Sulfurimonas lithotrophica]|uniref:Alanine racemase n=1 Tax=Sulfurimonas lithotrophica TaxID=2590022 RepID=A0A5P8P2L6_9BACT|nr:alanine racemase [Sulfurimonas lithotrophica]QFR49924.1 alanine racemase [Sulfurimonas lithotrophica]